MWSAMSEPTPIHEEFDPALEGELTALADGRLDPDRRAALDAPHRERSCSCCGAGRAAGCRSYDHRGGDQC